MHHRERDVGLDADYDGLRPAQLDGVGDGAQGACGERIHHIKRGNVHDNPAGAKLANAINEVVLQLQQLGVGERGLDGSDQVIALFEDRDRHCLLPLIFRVQGPIFYHQGLVTQQPVRLFDAALQVADGG